MIEDRMPRELRAAIGERVAQARTALGWDRAELARQYPLDGRPIKAIEGGCYHLSLWEALVLCQTLDLSLDELVGQTLGVDQRRAA